MIGSRTFLQLFSCAFFVDCSQY